MTTSPSGRLLLIRHGETRWSLAGRHTGLSDLPLTAEGERRAAALAPLVARFDVRWALCSPLLRARRTAALVGLTPVVDPDLAEWDYGGYEGLTTAEIRKATGTAWSLFDDGVVPGRTPGETIGEVAARVSRVLARVAGRLEAGDVALVGHGHCLRVLAATFLQQPPRLGAHLLLDAGSLSVLGDDRGVPAVRSWNRVP